VKYVACSIIIYYAIGCKTYTENAVNIRATKHIHTEKYNQKTRDVKRRVVK